MSFATILIVLGGAFVGGFINGFAGFGLALVVSGLWFTVLPAQIVPPLVVICATTGQLIGLAAMAKHLSFSKAAPMIIAGLIGVPLGTMLVAFTAPDLVKLIVGIFLILYTLWQFLGKNVSFELKTDGKIGDRVIGLGGGMLGGIAGLSGPLPIIWLQLRGLEPDAQRAIYQPFNLAILGFSVISMALFGQVTSEVLRLSLLAIPIVILGALSGIWLYRRVSAKGFKRAILALLLISGCVILIQSLGF